MAAFLRSGGKKERGGGGGGKGRGKRLMQGVRARAGAGGRITSSNVRRGNIDSTARRPLVPNRRVNGIRATPPPYRLSGLQATGPRRGGRGRVCTASRICKQEGITRE